MIKGWLDRGRRRSLELLDVYYTRAGYPGPLGRYRDAIRDRLGPDVCVLDAGCGAAMPMTRDVFPFVRLAVGVDVERPTPPRPGPHGCPADLNALPFRARSFDLIISLSVVEHLKDPERVFREFHRVLRPGGVVVAQTPNRFDYVSLIAAATPHAVHRWLIPRIMSRGAGDVFPTFYRANTRGRLERVLGTSGLVPREILYFNQYPAYLMFSPLLFRLGVLWERLTTRFRALAPLRGWILLVAEKPR